MESSKQYFKADDHAGIAKHLGLSVPEYLRQRQKGNIPCLEKPADSTPVVFLDDLNAWVAAGKPGEQLSRLGSNGRNY